MMWQRYWNCQYQANEEAQFWTEGVQGSAKPTVLTFVRNGLCSTSDLLTRRRHTPSFLMCDVTSHSSLLSFTRKLPYLFPHRKSVPCWSTQRKIFFPFGVICALFVSAIGPLPSHLLLQVVCHNIAYSSHVSADYNKSNVILRGLRLKNSQPCWIKKETLDDWTIEGKAARIMFFLTYEIMIHVNVS